jgi:hypothetical protein
MTTLEPIQPTVALNIPGDASFDQWMQTGQQLARMRDRLGFLVGDWINHGRGHFPEQMDLALESINIDVKFARRASLIAEQFPAHCRDQALSFDHHRAVIKLPQPERLELLNKAHESHWSIQDLREAVVQKRYENGSLFDDEDVDTALAVQIIRAWNRATPAGREYFYELAKVASLDVIDEDEVGNNGEE